MSQMKIRPFRAKFIALACASSAGAQPVPVKQAVPFACDSITENMVEIFSGFGAVSANFGESKPLKSGEEIFAADTPISLKKYTIAGSSLAQKRSVIFREYAIEGATKFCTTSPSNTTFGRGDTKRRFHLRCLIDENGDGLFEAAMPYGKYVRHNPLTGWIVTGPQAPPAVTLLPRPIGLVEHADAKLTDRKRISEINTRIKIGAIEEDTVEIIINSAVNVTPDEPGYELVGDRNIAVVRLFDGNSVEVEGAKIEIRQGEKGWAVRVSDYAGPKSELQCGGKVIALPRSFTIVTAERQRVELR